MTYLHDHDMQFGELVDVQSSEQGGKRWWQDITTCQQKGLLERRKGLAEGGREEQWTNKNKA